MELTITMLISAIVIGMTYTVYDIIAKSYGSFQTKNKDMDVLFTLDELLKKDFNRADTIFKVQNGIALSEPSGVITYDFEPDFIVRTSTIIDTFKLAVPAVNTSFEEQELAELSPTKEQNRIDGLDLTILFQDEKIPYHYHKVYSSANLMDRKAHAFN